MNQPIRLVKSMQIELKEDANGTFDGYAATFSRDTEGDRIVPGAFGQTISEKKGKIPIFMHHDRELWAGSSIDLAEDAKGLWMKAALYLNTSMGRDAWGLLKDAKSAGFPTGLSIGFIAKDWEWDEHTATRLIKEADVWETSITPWPANRQARVDTVKSLRTFEQLLRDETGCSAQSAKKLLSYASALSLPIVGGDPSPTFARDGQDAGTRNNVRRVLDAYAQQFGGL